MALTGDFSGSSSIGQATTIPTPADHATRLAAATYSGLDRTDLQSDTKLFTVAATPAAAVDGELTLNTTDITNGPTLRAQMYDATAAVHIDFALCVYSASTPASGYNIPGLLWRDTTLHIWRRYESATTAPNGVAGWHPVDAAYQLWKNESGGDLAANLVVIEKIAGTDDVRAFTTTTLEKDQLALGVTMEAITNDAYGVVAMVHGGATVLVQCLGSTHGAVAKGDALVCGTTAGKCRNAGPLAGKATVAGTTNYVGLQCGAFAEALEAQAADDLVRVRLLGQVGRGMMVFHDRSAGSVWSDTAPPTSFTSIDASDTAADDAGTQTGTPELEDAGHAPIQAFCGYLEVTGTDNAATSWKLQFSKNGSDVNHEISDNSGDITQDYERAHTLPWIPTSNSAGTTPGSQTQVKFIAGDGGVTWTVFRIRRTGYIC